jgi:hypothetical protein
MLRCAIQQLHSIIVDPNKQEPDLSLMLRYNHFAPECGLQEKALEAQEKAIWRLPTCAKVALLKLSKYILRLSQISKARWDLDILKF